MSYLRAEEILPKELLEAVQQYVNGQSVYIPAKEKSDWGSGTDTKQILDVRNREIFERILQVRRCKRWPTSMHFRRKASREL